MDVQRAAVMRRFWESINAGRYEALDRLLAAGYHDHFPPAFVTMSGRDAVKQTFRLPHLGLARPQYAIESMRDEGEVVVTRFTVRDGGVGDAEQLLPAGLRFELHGLYLCRIVDRHIVEGGALFEDLPMLQLAMASARGAAGGVAARG